MKFFRKTSKRAPEPSSGDSQILSPAEFAVHNWFRLKRWTEIPDQDGRAVKDELKGGNMAGFVVKNIASTEYTDNGQLKRSQNTIDLDMCIYLEGIPGKGSFKIFEIETRVSMGGVIGGKLCNYKTIYKHGQNKQIANTSGFELWLMML